VKRRHFSSSSWASRRDRRKLRDVLSLSLEDCDRRTTSVETIYKKTTPSSPEKKLFPPLNFFIDLLLINLISQAGTGIETTKVCVII